MSKQRKPSAMEDAVASAATQTVPEMLDRLQNIAMEENEAFNEYLARRKALTHERIMLMGQLQMYQEMHSKS